MVVLNAALLMFEFSIPMPNPMLVPSLQLTDAMRTLKGKHMARGCGKLNTLHFTPTVMSATGGLAPEATTFYRRLASLLASRWGDDYSVVMGWLHCSLSFSLLQSAIACRCAWCSFIYRTFSLCSTAT